MADISQVSAGILSPLCQQYGLHFAALKPSSVLLVARNFALHFYTEPRDTGLFMDYIDIPRSPEQAMRSYALGLFLFLRRPIPPAFTKEAAARLSEEERIRFSIMQCARILLEKGQDILRGEKEWLKEYSVSWTSDPVWPELADAIRERKSTVME